MYLNLLIVLLSMLMVTYVSIKDDKEDVTYIFDEYGILTSIKTKTGFESRINYDEYGFITNIDMETNK